MVLRWAALARKLEPGGFGAIAKSDRVLEENVAKERLIEADPRHPRETKGYSRERCGSSVQHGCDVSSACDPVIFRRGVGRCRVW